MKFEFKSNSPQDTQRLGSALAELLPPRATLSFCGTLGAGKTFLVQAIATAVGVDRREVTSPTFVLCQHYHGARTIHHLDAYRIKDEDEFFELGVDEYIESEGLTIVEWGDRVADCLPPDCVCISMEISGNDARQISISTNHADHAEWLTALADRLG